VLTIYIYDPSLGKYVILNSSPPRNIAHQDFSLQATVWKGRLVVVGKSRIVDIIEDLENKKLFSTYNVDFISNTLKIPLQHVPW
jgi:hypothetical protein